MTGPHLAAEIAAQPAAWRRAAGLAPALRDLLGGDRVVGGRVGADWIGGGRLGGGRFAIAGCGTSFHVAQAVAALAEARSLGRFDAFCASEMPIRRGYDGLVVVSRSADTAEVLDLLGRAAGTPTVAIVGRPDGPVAAAAGSALALEFADERSVVQSRFATSVVALFRALAGEDVEPLAAAAEAVLAGPVVDLTGVRRVVVLGTGAGVGLAHEAALKLREAALAVSESYPAMEYRHGPIALAEPGVLVWVLGTPPAGLVDDVLRAGAEVVDDDLDPLADLVRVQLSALDLARSKGLDPDRPRHLTRAALLPGPDPAR